MNGGAVRAARLLVCLVLLPCSASAASLRDRLRASSLTVGIAGGSAFDALADNIADTAARNLPIISGSAGYTYRYNPQLEIFERTSETLGPLFLERPDTLGRGKLNVNVSYQYVQFDEFDGRSIKRLEAQDPIVIQEFDSAGNLLRSTANRLRYGLKIHSNIGSLSLTYGLLDNLDVNLLLPVIDTDFAVGVQSQVIAMALPGGGFSAAPEPLRIGRTQGNAVGIGDILLRGKYQFPAMEGGVRSAAGLQLRLPSGNENDFQGTGDFEASPFLYLSTILWSHVEPHANLGVDLRTDNVERSQARYGLGADVDVTRRIGISLAFLGRSQFKESAPASDTSFLHLTSAGVQQRPLLGVSFDRKDFFDLSFGARAVVWRQIMVFANGIYALNDDGLRNGTVIPTAGVEGTF